MIVREQSTPFRVEVTYTNGKQQSFNASTLDAMWQRVGRLRANKDVRRIRVLTEIATFEITES